MILCLGLRKNERWFTCNSFHEVFIVTIICNTSQRKWTTMVNGRYGRQRSMPPFVIMILDIMAIPWYRWSWLREGEHFNVPPRYHDSRHHGHSMISMIMTTRGEHLNHIPHLPKKAEYLAFSSMSFQEYQGHVGSQHSYNSHCFQGHAHHWSR